MSCGVLGVAQGGEPEKRVDGGQPTIAGPGHGAAFALEVVQERSDQRGVELGEVWPGCLGAVSWRRSGAAG